MTKHTPEQLALARVTREDAIEWMERAMRNFRHLSISEDDIEDVRLELERFRRAAIVETTGLAVDWLDQRAVQNIEEAKRCRSGNAGRYLRAYAERRVKDAHDLRTYAHLKDPSHADG